MPKSHVNYTVSPMQVQISVNADGDALEKAEKALKGWLNAGIKQTLGHMPSDSSILVTYLEYQVEESWTEV